MAVAVCGTLGLVTLTNLSSDPTASTLALAFCLEALGLDRATAFACCASSHSSTIEGIPTLAIVSGIHNRSGSVGLNGFFGLDLDVASASPISSAMSSISLSLLSAKPSRPKSITSSGSSWKL